MMNSTKISRLELIRLRGRKKLVSHGVEILTSKKDALLIEFRHMMINLHAIRERLEANMTEAARSLVMARAQEPDHFLSTQAIASQRKVSFNIVMKKVWGVKSPRIDFPDTRRDPFGRGSAPGYRSMAVDGAAENFETALNTLASAGVAEFRLLEMGGAIQRTTRRINALNMRLLPQINRDMEKISSRLEEMERDDRFRLKRFKSLRGREGK
ncbi:MAG: V-type ATP synthase subunit D [Nitrospinota bacterium]|nr:V-type ATP synthase subunit D [Nitrospinota bacterium]